MLDDLDASREQRERLVKALAYKASAKRVDKTLFEAVREVFDPAGHRRASPLRDSATGRPSLASTTHSSLRRAELPAS